MKSANCLDFDNKISVIIPFYNAEASIEKCLDSIVSQTYRNFEIIMVDDGSTDNSGVICERYVKRCFDENLGIRIGVSHIDNNGVSNARNYGIRESKGKWITFVDADDYVEKDYLKKLIDGALNWQKQNIELGIKNESVFPVMVTMTNHIPKASSTSGYDYVEKGILNRDSHVWAKLYKKDFLIDNQIFFKEGWTIGEDVLFLLDIACILGKEKDISVIEDDSYHYIYDNSQGAMNSSYKASYLDQIRCWDEVEKRVLPLKGEISEFTYVQLSVVQCMSAMLVASKVARNSKNISRDEKKEAIEFVKKSLEHSLRKNRTFLGLSFGYKVKILLFKFSPWLYLQLYRGWKNTVCK